MFLNLGPPNVRIILQYFFLHKIRYFLNEKAIAIKNCKELLKSIKIDIMEDVLKL